MKNSDLSVSIVLLEPELRVNAAYRFSIIKGPFEHRQTVTRPLHYFKHQPGIVNQQAVHYTVNESLSANMLDNAWFSTFLLNIFWIDQQKWAMPYYCYKWDNTNKATFLKNTGLIHQVHFTTKNNTTPLTIYHHGFDSLIPFPGFAGLWIG